MIMGGGVRGAFGCNAFNKKLFNDLRTLGYGRYLDIPVLLLQSEHWCERFEPRAGEYDTVGDPLADRDLQHQPCDFGGINID